MKLNAEGDDYDTVCENPDKTETIRTEFPVTHRTGEVVSEKIIILWAQLKRRV